MDKEQAGFSVVGPDDWIVENDPLPPETAPHARVEPDPAANDAIPDIDMSDFATAFEQELNNDGYDSNGVVADASEAVAQAPEQAAESAVASAPQAEEPEAPVAPEVPEELEQPLPTHNAVTDNECNNCASEASAFKPADAQTDAENTAPAPEDDDTTPPESGQVDTPPADDPDTEKTDAEYYAEYSHAGQELLDLLHKLYGGQIYPNPLGIKKVFSNVAGKYEASRLRMGILPTNGNRFSSVTLKDGNIPLYKITAKDALLAKGQTLTETKAFELAVIALHNPAMMEQGIRLRGSVPDKEVLMRALLKAEAMFPQGKKLKILNPIDLPEAEANAAPEVAKGEANPTVTIQREDTEPTTPSDASPKPEETEVKSPAVDGTEDDKIDPSAYEEVDEDDLFPPSEPEATTPAKKAEQPMGQEPATFKMAATNGKVVESLDSATVLDMLKKPDKEGLLNRIKAEAVAQTGTAADALSDIDLEVYLAEQFPTVILSEQAMLAKVGQSLSKVNESWNGEPEATASTQNVPDAEPVALNKPTADIKGAFDSARGQKWEVNVTALQAAKDLIAETGNANISDFREAFGIGSGKAGRLMEALASEGVVEREGGNPKGHWVVKNTHGAPAAHA